MARGLLAVLRPVRLTSSLSVIVQQVTHGDVTYGYTRVARARDGDKQVKRHLTSPQLPYGCSGSAVTTIRGDAAGAMDPLPNFRKRQGHDELNFGMSLDRTAYAC